MDDRKGKFLERKRETKENWKTVMSTYLLYLLDWKPCVMYVYELHQEREAKWMC